MQTWRLRPMAGVLLCLGPADGEGSIRADCGGISEAAETPLTTVRIASGLVRPLFVTAPPGDLGRIFVLEQDGRVRIVKDGALLATPFLDIGALTRSPADSGGFEEGLLGLAFHPDYAANGLFFVYHTDATGENNLVARYARSAADADLADPASRQVVIAFPHPANSNHNGGMIAFGPLDGFLYIGTGDGGGACDIQGNAQNGASNLGKILRIDVESLPYSIPTNNPFAPGGDPGGLVNDEIWALGLRNPWRFSFAGGLAPSAGDLYIGDVGQTQWEEIDYRPSSSPGGENYGWKKYEGAHCPNPSCGSADCVVSGNVLPVHEYDHAGGACSVTGGYAYAGCRMPGLRGTYFFADYCAAFIRSFRIDGGAPVDPRDRTAELAPGGAAGIGQITSFGEDARGEIYIVDQGLGDPAGGEVFKVVPVLRNLEVSGVGAAPFLLGTSAWSWEDLHATSGHPIAAYRVYRSAGNGSAPFDCARQGAATSWPGGDPDAPPPGGLFAYLVTAVNAAGEETSPGRSSSGASRTLSGSPCPPP